jgi:hypothetical protein
MWEPLHLAAHCPFTASYSNSLPLQILSQQFSNLREEHTHDFFPNGKNFILISMFGFTILRVCFPWLSSHFFAEFGE